MLSTGPHSCPGHPRAPDLPSPLPLSNSAKLKTTPKPQRARPWELEAHARGAPSRRRLPAPARCVSAAAAAASSRLAGGWLPAPRCGGDARSRPTAEASRGAGRGAAPGPTPRARGRRAGRCELCGTLCARGRSRTVWMRAYREEGKGTGENCSPSRLGSASPWPTLSDRSPRAEREGVMQDG